MRAVPILAVLLFSCADSPLSSTPTVGPSPAAPPGATAAATPTGPGPSVDPGSTPSTRLVGAKHSPPASHRTSFDPSIVSVRPHERP